ncbi:MAG: hypothetical protein GX610_00275, partial [Rhodococcus sp.]|nr:hypothetical protein [Rhodococcus sp. (in: high G+C Gram-positive bacteria)]
DPRFGYRAVHLEVSVFGVQAEIQVRTGLQHLWAESMERLADRFGRGLRYGDRSVLDNLDAGLRAEVVDLLQILERMSEQVNQFESVAASWPTGSRDHAAGVRLHTARTTLEDVFVEFRAALDDVG